jgi:hypothetical protein
MTFVAVITVLSRRLDVALAFSAEFPRLALDGFFTFFRCFHASLLNLSYSARWFCSHIGVDGLYSMYWSYIFSRVSLSM